MHGAVVGLIRFISLRQLSRITRPKHMNTNHNHENITQVEFDSFGFILLPCAMQKNKRQKSENKMEHQQNT